MQRQSLDYKYVAEDRAQVVEGIEAGVTTWVRATAGSGTKRAEKCKGKGMKG